MTYAFARIGAVVAMRVEDYFANGKRWWVRLHEKGGKRHEMPGELYRLTRARIMRFVLLGTYNCRRVHVTPTQSPDYTHVLLVRPAPSSSSFSNAYFFYPNEIGGQLFFTKPSGNFVCSASVIRLSVIATAGHCVSDGNGHFFANWLFVPAEFAGTAPFGTWNAAQVWVTGPWHHGGGVVPNRQDDALIVLAANSRGQKIGQLTGWLGFEYNAPLPTHLTQLGYPCNLDSCAEPISDNSQVFSGPTNNFEWGTAAFGGASGGPEIQDFGQQPSHASGTPPSEIFGGNILISSTSYTYSTDVQVDGGSILAAPGQFGGSLNTFGDLLNAACATTGNC